ncbi:hypothetical protein ACFO0A_00600 [Novosphingobium tardum]|uniref:Uncharacterized protein n=1 Tax=Novosphingobium tardum TaxID=1538021 RepID=A0ABV8RJU0_9SPHN
MNCDDFDDRDDALVLDDYLVQGLMPRAGYWSPFSALAWIASRADEYIAAVQTYEVDQHANLGGLHSSAAWTVLGDDAGARFGITFTEAARLLREALEEGRIVGAIAKNLADGVTGPVEAYQWTDWSRTFIPEGLSLIPGFVDFKFPSKSIREGFPASNAAISRPSVSRARTKGESEQWYTDRVKNWSGDRHPSRDDDIAAGRLLGLNAERVKELRRTLAPSTWRMGGRPQGS